MTQRCDTCEYHEDRGLLISQHGAMLAANRVEIDNMQEGQAVLIQRFEAAANSTGTALKEMCADLKVLKQRTTKPGAVAADAEVEKAFENQPIGYLNKALKSVFTSPAFWAIFGWVVLKIVIFGEYPSFVQKTRPYMAPIIKSQQEAGTLEYHFKDASGREVTLIPTAKPVIPTNELLGKPEEKK
jgi:hypothetical protein